MAADADPAPLSVSVMGVLDSAFFVRVDSSGDVIYDLGVGILKNHLRTYYHYVLKGTTSYRMARVVNESIAFVHGSGLEMTLQQFGFAADPDTFRETYLEWCAWQKRHQMLVLSSVTTLAVS